MANIGSMDDIQSLFKETIAEFMENGLEAELDDGFALITKTRTQTTAATGIATKCYAPALEMWMYWFPETGRGNLSPGTEKESDQYQPGHRGKDPVHVRHGHDYQRH